MNSVEIVLAEEVAFAIPPPVIRAFEGYRFTPDRIGHDVRPDRHLVLVGRAGHPVLVERNGVRRRGPEARVIG